MKELRSRVCFSIFFVAMFLAFKEGIKLRPPGEDWDTAYFVGAALVDWMIYRVTPFILNGSISRDVEALCIASIAAHAIGFALYMAWSLPSVHNFLIKGINYVLAIRLLLTGSGDVFNHHYLRDFVRSNFFRRPSYMGKEAQR